MENVVKKTDSADLQPKWLEYFDCMGKKERAEVSNWLVTQRAAGKAQTIFLEWVKEALAFVCYDYRIANLEPSLDSDGKLYYEKGKPVCEGLSVEDWQEKAKMFSVQYKSNLANVYELLLWYAYRIAKGKWSIYYVCNDSSSRGNYKNSPGATHCLEVSGSKFVGGARDGVGNTIKIVEHVSGFFTCGGDYTFSGKKFPVADLLRGHNRKAICDNCVGVIVLRG